MLIFLEIDDGWWNRGKIVICSIYCSIHPTEFLQKAISFDFQCSLVSQDTGLGVIQRFDFANGRFC
jgi:hypothetical protein